MKGSNHTQPNQNGQLFKWAEIPQSNNKKCVFLMEPSIKQVMIDDLSYRANIINEQTMFTVAEYEHKNCVDLCIQRDSKGNSQSIKYEEIFGSHCSSPFFYIKFTISITDGYAKTLQQVQKAAKIIDYLNTLNLEEIYDSTISWIQNNLF